MNRPSEPAGGPLSSPLFPLPNVVLFPRAVLPLHIFEERYKAMTADALAGDRLVAMALLRPGWQRDYYGRPPVEPVVCLGRIVSSEKLPDGKFNFLLQGIQRCTILREIPAESPYRTARLAPLEESPADEIELADDRQAFHALFTRAALSHTVIGQRFCEMLAGPMLTGHIADLIAFHFFEDVALKQSLLCECDVRRRVSRIVSAMEDMTLAIEAQAMARIGNAAMN